jgi:hypothetical protein
MNDSAGGKRSSPFDRMLDENRRQFDALLTRRAPAARPEPRAESPRPSAPTEMSAPPAAAPPPRSADGEVFDIRATDIGQTLARRYGENWRFEIVDRRRDGEDVVVWARLTAGDHDKTRRGRARIQGAGRAAPISAQAGDTGFVLRAGDEPASAVSDDPERTAYEQAAALALAACAKGL